VIGGPSKRTRKDALAAATTRRDAHSSGGVSLNDRNTGHNDRNITAIATIVPTTMAKRDEDRRLVSVVRSAIAAARGNA